MYELTIRPLNPDDAIRLGVYFQNLSVETRSLYGPHPFDQATADAICAALDPNDMIRMVAVLEDEGEKYLLAYFLLKLGVHDSDQKRYIERGMPLDQKTDCTLAPSVADSHQNQGLGSQMMQHVLQMASQLGRQRVVLWGGVQARNARAIHFYTKWGFRKVGEFYTDKNNFDMILELPAPTLTEGIESREEA